MDRDKRWERIKIAIDGLVQGEGEKVEGGQEGLIKAIEENYKKDVTDEFLKPIIVNGDEGRIKGEFGRMVDATPAKCYVFRRRYHLLL